VPAGRGMFRVERVEEAVLRASASCLEWEWEWDFTVCTLCEDAARYTSRLCSE
jgi:hypothetical protein